MLLRKHPLMRYRTVPSWPPVWTWIGGLGNTYLQGEIGILRNAELSRVQPANRCFLYIDHEGSSYIGCLLIDDEAFCRHIVKLLQGSLNSPIAEIGSLDLSYTL